MFENENESDIGSAQNEYFRKMREAEAGKSSVRVVRIWDELPPALQDGVDFFSTRVLHRKHMEAVRVAKALRDYIDAIPKAIEFGEAMPGVDRD